MVVVDSKFTYEKVPATPEYVHVERHADGFRSSDSPARSAPMTRTSSSWTTLRNACPGLRAEDTSIPRARVRTASTLLAVRPLIANRRIRALVERAQSDRCELAAGGDGHVQ